MFSSIFDAVANASAAVPPQPTFKPDRHLVEALLTVVLKEKWSDLTKIVRGQMTRTTDPVDPEITKALDQNVAATMQARWPNLECFSMAAVTSRKGFSSPCHPLNSYTLINSAAHLDRFPITAFLGIADPTKVQAANWYLDEQIGQCKADGILISNMASAAYPKLPPIDAVKAILLADVPSIRLDLPADLQKDFNVDFLFDGHEDGNIFKPLSEFYKQILTVQALSELMPMAIHCKRVVDMLKDDQIVYVALATEAGERIDLSGLDDMVQVYAELVVTLDRCADLITRAHGAALTLSQAKTANTTPAMKMLSAFGGDQANTRAFYDGLALDNVDHKFLNKLCNVSGLSYSGMLSSNALGTTPKVKQGYAFGFRVIDILMQMLLGPLGYNTQPPDQSTLDMRNKLLKYLHTADYFCRQIAALHSEQITGFRIKSATLANPEKPYYSNKNLFARFDKFEDNLNLLLTPTARSQTLRFDSATLGAGDVYITKSEALFKARKNELNGHFALSHLQLRAADNPVQVNTMTRCDYTRHDSRPDEVRLPSEDEGKRLINTLKAIQQKLYF